MIYIVSKKNLVNNFILFIIHLIILYLLIILISFNPEDPSWMQTSWNESTYNIGGLTGAHIADFLFFIFGSVAYIIPLLILVYFWIIYINFIKVNILILLILAGTLILLIMSCGIMQLLYYDDIFYFSSGGLIGHILCDVMKFYQNAMIFQYNLNFLLIGIMWFFSPLLLYLVTFIVKKIVWMIKTIFILFSKYKSNRYDHQRKFYKFRIPPTILSMQNDNLFKKTTTYNLLKIRRNYSKYSDLIYSNMNLNFTNQNNIIQFQSISSTTLNQTHHKIKNRIKNNLKSNMYFEKKNENHHYTQCIDKKKYQSKKNFNTVEKYNKITDSHFSCPNSTKKIYVNNIITITDAHRIPTTSSCFLNKKNIKPTKEYINQHKYTVSLDKKLNIVKNMQTQFDQNSSKLPDINLLITNPVKNLVNDLQLIKTSQLIEKKLFEYRIVANVMKTISGSVVTRFELKLSAGIKSSKISSLSRDLARSLSTTAVRVIEIIPGTPYIGLEIPNKIRKMVYLRNIISSKKFYNNNSPLSLALGEDVSGQPIVEDLRCMPHLLVAGTTGSGKSVGINTMIISILYKATPEEVRFIMIDPKILELSAYSNIPHLLQEVIIDPQKADLALQWCIKEMEHRYKLMAMISVRNLEQYNNYIKLSLSKKNQFSCVTTSIKQCFDAAILDPKKFKKLPYIVIIIDEFADLMIATNKKIEMSITRLTQKARAAGIHLILSTQRPSVDVITGLIKSNIPARIAFAVSSKIDSRTILGQSGAESLLGSGDMLYLSSNSSMPTRIHGSSVQDEEIYAVTQFWKNYLCTS